MCNTTKISVRAVVTVPVDIYRYVLVTKSTGDEVSARTESDVWTDGACVFGYFRTYVLRESKKIQLRLLREW
jgi:hypothetical protein